ncbi:MAG: sugar phosphate isomerase/epimerase [Planctomycetaceae bacterium]|nr:sugar phosphate isomerase/epimerase [Planctomycetaceae bacterium]
MNPTTTQQTRRQFGQQAIGTTATCLTALSHASQAAETIAPTKPFSLKYILGSPMYGTTPLPVVSQQAKVIGANYIDLWPRPHADHREQMRTMGRLKFQQMLQKNNLKLGMLTRYDLGPYRLASEIELLRDFGGKLIVCGAQQQTGDSLKKRVAKFVESMKPHVAIAEAHDVVIGIENHGGNLLSSPDSIRYFADCVKSPHLGLAMAPYHLPQDPTLIGSLIRHLGKEHLAFFQAWQHGKGCMKKLPKADELLQMPGRGKLDFQPIVAALRDIQYDGWTEIFMHPVPRGIPILPTTAEVSAEINQARNYLSRCVSQVNRQ